MNFWLLCIPARTMLTLAPLYLEENQLEIYSYLLFAIGTSFMYLYFTNSRMNAFESSTGVTWWANYRIIHGLLYLIAAYYAYTNQATIIPLLIDTLFGILLWSLK